MNTPASTIDGLRFDDDYGGLIRAVYSTPDVAGEVFLHGAQCTGWQPRGHEPVLWMSRHSYFQAGKPIRGGVPICFPWFGPHATNSQAPAHGLARTQTWQATRSQKLLDGSLSLLLETSIAPFDLSYEIVFGSQLRLCLTVRLPSAHPTQESFEAALHTYLRISDIRNVSISGLESIPYIDKVNGPIGRLPEGQPITFAGETDRVYAPTADTCVLHDPGMKRKIVIRKFGSQSTVVWNPWIDKSARMPDFGDDEWPGMVCIETANISPQATWLQPGHSHSMTVEIGVNPD